MLPLDELINDYVTSNPKSRKAYERAQQLLPGGNTRSVLNSDPFPLVIKSGHGSRVTSVDNREYIDFISEFTSGFFGHSHPVIHGAVIEALSSGFGLSGVTEKEAELAEVIQKRMPSIEKVRYCSSGTEANMYALSAAIVFTGRKKVLVFDHGYHGGTMNFHNADNPMNLPYDFVVGKFDSIEETRPLLCQELAAILVEPMQAAGGMRMASKDFIVFLREAATQTGTVLIFDECVTSRLHFNGLQGALNVIPDLTVLGKYLGGGFPFGAFGGRAEIMNMFDPSAQDTKHTLYHSGTFNGNTFSLTSALAVSQLLTPEAIDQVNRLGDRLRDSANSLIRAASFEEKMSFSGYGSEVGIHFHGEQQEELRDYFYFLQLKAGIMIGCRGFVSLNLMHSDEDVDRMLQCLKEFLHSCR